VKMQLRVAAGEPLSLTQEQVRTTGHAIECRINAESPALGFRPSPGRVSRFRAPGGPGVRIDSHLYEGYTVPPYYDSLVAKIITHGTDRAEAVARMRRALGETVIEGIDTTIPFHLEILEDPEFLDGRVDTGFVERRQNRLKATPTEG
jgi:acetyl-CoA carboxylase, biotin carboxylase subunit